jgi:hypothetical protein
MKEKITEIEKAKEIIRQEHEKKVKACAEEIQAVLDKYGLKMVITNPEIRLQ